MLRVELEQHNDFLLINVEGKLKGDYADHARTLMTTLDPEPPLVVDLREVTYVDSAGEEVLALLAHIGARFMAESTYTRYVCERLHLPLTRSTSSGDTNLEV